MEIFDIKRFSITALNFVFVDNSMLITDHRRVEMRALIPDIAVEYERVALGKVTP